MPTVKTPEYEIVFESDDFEIIKPTGTDPINSLLPKAMKNTRYALNSSFYNHALTHVKLPNYIVRKNKIPIYMLNLHNGIAEADDAHFTQSIDRFPEIVRDKIAELATSAIIAGHGQALGLIDPAKRNRRICLLAVSRAGFALPSVPVEERDEVMWEVALAASGRAIHFVPEQSVTRRMIDIASLSYAVDLTKYPHVLISPESCQGVLDSGGSLSQIHQRHRTPEMAAQACAKNGSNLSFVRTADRNPDLCLASVTSNPISLGLVPFDRLTREVFQAAVRRDHRSVGFLDERFRQSWLETELSWVVQEHPRFIFEIQRGFLSNVIIDLAWRQGGESFGNRGVFMSWRREPVPDSLGAKHIEYPKFAPPCTERQLAFASAIALSTGEAPVDLTIAGVREFISRYHRPPVARHPLAVVDPDEPTYESTERRLVEVMLPDFEGRPVPVVTLG